jgi:hypothetical protein
MIGFEAVFGAYSLYLFSLTITTLPKSPLSPTAGKTRVVVTSIIALNLIAQVADVWLYTTKVLYEFDEFQSCLTA